MIKNNYSYIRGDVLQLDSRNLLKKLTFASFPRKASGLKFIPPYPLLKYNLLGCLEILPSKSYDVMD